MWIIRTPVQSHGISDRYQLLFDHNEAIDYINAKRATLDRANTMHAHQGQAGSHITVIFYPRLHPHTVILDFN